MGGRAWSQEELIRLEELTEKYPLATVARILNRSENAVFLKRQRTEVSQMKMFRKQGFTIREIAEKMNRSESSIKYKLYGREKSNGRS